MFGASDYKDEEGENLPQGKPQHSGGKQATQVTKFKKRILSFNKWWSFGK